MKAFLRNAVIHGIAELKLAEMLNKKFFNNTLSIITYHAVVRHELPVYDWCFINEYSFRNQISYLRSHFDVVPLSTAIGLIGSGRINGPTAAITFDDGFQNNYDIAFPILREAKVPATIFLTTKFIDTDDGLWFCRLNRALAKTSKSTLRWKGCVLDIKSATDKAGASAGMQEMLKEVPHSQLLREVREIIRFLGDEPDSPIGAESPYRMMSSDSIAEMMASGLIEFGAHTEAHAILALLSLEDRREEISRSVRYIEKLTGRPCEVFSYPNGGPGDYGAETIRILRSCGVRAAVTTIPGPNDGNTPLMELKRYGIDGNISLAKFKAKVHHVIWASKNARDIMPLSVLRFVGMRW